MKNFNSYLFFDGNCREAMKFYEKCFGGELFMAPFAEAKMEVPPAAKDRIMHAKLSNGAAVLMASDTMSGQAVKPGNNFSISVHTETVEETERFFKALGDQGTVTMPLQETFWAQRFGMLTDRFGVQWMFNLDKAH